jgi:hypothetical protein
LLSGGGWFGIALLVVFAEVVGRIISLGLINETEVDQIFEVLTIVNVLLDSKSLILLGSLWEVLESDPVLILIVESWLDLREDLYRHLLIDVDFVRVSTLLRGEEVKLGLFISKVVWLDLEFRVLKIEGSARFLLGISQNNLNLIVT